jgi:general secretion pathway protein D
VTHPRRTAAVVLLLACALVYGAPAGSQAPTAATGPDGDELVQLDFNNVELTVVIDTIAQLTGRNFIYDDRVRGRVTVVSPTKIGIDEAYAVFESVLQVKGFTTVPTPGGALKVIPLRDAKETSVETSQSIRPPANRDRFITRLIPLRYIEADSIVNTLKPLVSKDAAIAAYSPTNTVILTESASNIRRLIAILESIDVDTYKEELAVLRVEFADASTLAEQVSEIYGAEVTGAPTPTVRRSTRRTGTPTPTPTPTSPLRQVRIITDERTNSLIVLAARAQLEEVRSLVKKLDVPVSGGGRVHVYYLQHADAEELAQTLSSLISGAPAATGGAAPGAAGQAQALRAAVTGLAEGVTVTADPPTNALVIQASQEGYAAIAAVIEKLDVERPQVLVEALIMEVDITDQQELGFNGLYRLINGDTDVAIQSATDGDTVAALGQGGPVAAAIPFFANFLKSTIDGEDDDGSVIQGIIRAAATDDRTNIVSAPHILTSDNEEAEIRVGDNIPIITSRIESAAGQEVGLSTSANIERQDIGVTLRVTPQITEGETLRLDIFQEITALNPALTVATSAASGQSGVALSNRRIENTVVVSDGETVVIGGILTDDYKDNITKVPWLGDIPILGWVFKTVSRELTKKNLLVFLTPHIVRSAEDLESESIRKREEFRQHTGEALMLSEERRQEELRLRAEARAQGTSYVSDFGRDPARQVVLDLESRYPLERMREIEELQRSQREKEGAKARRGPSYIVQAAVLGDEKAAIDALTVLVDAGYDGTLLSGETAGVVLYEIRLGPYDTLDEAERVGEVIRRSHDMTPSVLVEPPTAETP